MSILSRIGWANQLKSKNQENSKAVKKTEIVSESKEVKKADSEVVLEESTESEVLIEDTSKYLPKVTLKEKKETEEFVKLSAKAQDALIKEQYRQRLKRQFVFEEKYRR